MLNHSYIEQDLAAACAAAGSLDWLKGRRVLITGATGMIGSFLTETLSWLNEREGAGIELYARAQGMRMPGETRYNPVRGSN